MPPEPVVAGVAVDPAEVAKFDAVAHRFWDPDGEFKPLHALNPMRAGFVAERCRLEGAKVVDVGCGGGLLAEALVRRGARMSGIDLSGAMIEVARLHAEGAGLTIDYRQRSAESLVAEAAGSFDVVTCMEMLEHVPDPASMVGTLGALLRPGGDLFLSTLNRTPKAFAVAIVGAEYLARLLPRGTHEYAKFIRPSEIAAAARHHGLECLEIAGLDYNPITGFCTLTRDPSVNYLVHLRRAGPVSG
jgi:2-polyprenyl-6-hydroxyphenyl methylase / 3-demethylubiquinone-9 3-methyltransferase